MQKALTVYKNTYPIEEVITPYLSDAERKEILNKGNCASQILGKQSMRLKELSKQGFIEDFRHMEMTNMLVEFNNLQGKSERIKISHIPVSAMIAWVFHTMESIGENTEKPFRRWPKRCPNNRFKQRNRDRHSTTHR